LPVTGHLRAMRHLLSSADLAFFSRPGSNGGQNKPARPT
jgi:hypothetical protein